MLSAFTALPRSPAARASSVNAATQALRPTPTREDVLLVSDEELSIAVFPSFASVSSRRQTALPICLDRRSNRSGRAVIENCERPNAKLFDTLQMYGTPTLNYQISANSISHPPPSTVVVFLFGCSSAPSDKSLLQRIKSSMFHVRFGSKADICSAERDLFIR